MATKKKVKKIKKAPEKTSEEKDSFDDVSKEVKEEENKSVLWILVFGVLLLAAVVIPYVYIKESKSFERFGVNWTVEEQGELTIYHGRFTSFARKNIIYNLYLRNDPRENDVTSEGEFTQFKRVAVIGYSPEADSCRGEVARNQIVLNDFLRNAVGLNSVFVGTSDSEVAEETGRYLANCETAGEASVIVIKLGNESSVVEGGEYCHIITMENCTDNLATEKYYLEIIRQGMQ